MAATLGTGASAPISKVGTSTGASPTTSGATGSITTPTTNPAGFVFVSIADSAGMGSDIINTPTTTFGGTVSRIAHLFSVSGHDITTDIYKIVAPTANTAGTVTVTFDGASGVLYEIVVVMFSDAHQTDPSPTADAVTSQAVTSPETMTPANMTANDASIGGATTWPVVNRPNLAASPNSIYLTANDGEQDCSVGYNTGTTGVTLSVTTGSDVWHKIGVRVVAAAGGGAAAPMFRGS